MPKKRDVRDQPSKYELETGNYISPVILLNVSLKIIILNVHG
jgi:hypothetical protein